MSNVVGPHRTDNPEICPPKVASKFGGQFISGGIGVGGLGNIAAKLPDTESEASLEEATKEGVAPAAHLERDDSAHPQ